MGENEVEAPRKDNALVTAIIVAGVLACGCIVAITAISIAFIANAPW